MGKKNVIVVGSGIAGLACAIRLAVRGFDVQVFEASERAGGKLHQFELGPYRFDFGPSLFTLPELVDDLFKVAGKDPQAYFNYHKLDTLCRYFWEDGTQTSTFASLDQTIKRLQADLGEEEESLQAYFSSIQSKYESVGHIFLEKSLHKASTWLTKEVLGALGKIPKLDLFSQMHAVNSSYFRNKKTVQLFDRYATYNGSNPFRAPGLLTMIPHLEFGYGAYLPHHGMNDISASLYKLACELGVSFHFNKEVKSLLVSGKHVKGVELKNGENHLADLFVSNMDAYLTYKHLLNRPLKAANILKQERSTSAMIFYWGMEGVHDQLDVHNILFAENYKQEFDALARRQVSDDPTVYIHITSKLVVKDAPEGHENWFVMINTPGNFGQDWDAESQKLKRKVISKINRTLNVDLDQKIRAERIVRPDQIESLTKSHTGSLYGTASNDRFSAFLRHPNFSKEYNNLFFLGGTVHPGGGIPLCLHSAKIVDRLITD